MITLTRLQSLERQFIEDGFNDVRDSEVAQIVEMAISSYALTEQRDALVVENVGLKEILEYAINTDNTPEYHDQGMGCGVEDRGYQRNGYAACEYGWQSALDRVYSEVLPDALPETPVTDAARASLRAEGVEMAITVVVDCSKNICAGGEPEARQYEESIVNPHLDGIHDELTTIARQLRESKGEVCNG